MLADTLADEVPYPHGWPRLLRDGGFSHVMARTFPIDALAPLDQAQADLVVHLLTRTLQRDQEQYGPLLDSEDRETLRKLTDPDDPAFVLRRDDLHLCAGVSVYLGQK
jgi:hypothetical protein